MDSTRLDTDLRRVLGDRFIPGSAVAAGVERAADGIHFTRPGYRDLATRLVAAVIMSRATPVAGWTVVLLTALLTLLVAGTALAVITGGARGGPGGPR